MRHFAATFAIITILLSATAPGVAASHWTLYYSDVERSVGATYEDDNAVLRASGNPFDGRTNRVVAPGSQVGGGGLFLDMRVGSWVGTPLGGTVLSGTAVFSDFLTSGVLNRNNVLLPGDTHWSAWFGWWQDANQDKIIDDVHDGNCGASLCANDEFEWRGVGSGEPGVGMLAWMVPSYSSPAATGISFHAMGNQSRSLPNTFVDETARTRAEQGWVNYWIRSSYDAGFFTTVQTLNIAGGRPVVDGGFGYDLDDPNALVDVDRYESLSPDVESLFASTAGVLKEEAALRAFIMQEVVGDAWAETFENVTLTLRAAQAAVASANPRTAYSQWVTVNPREPNHVEDDFGGRAALGVGDTVGSGNSYAGYADGTGPHFFLDAIPRTLNCAGAYAAVPGTTVFASQTRCVSVSVVDGIGSYNAETDPFGAQSGDGRRSASLGMSWSVRAVIWEDLNKDGYHGAICDPEGADYDTTSATCANAPWPPRYFNNGGEIAFACSFTDLRTGTITATPMGGEWSNTLIVRDWTESTRPAFGVMHEFATGSTPVSLRLTDTCEVSTRDALVFLDGASRVPIRIETRATLVGFHDATSGVDIEEETVRDVDVLPAAL